MFEPIVVVDEQHYPALREITVRPLRESNNGGPAWRGRGAACIRFHAGIPARRRRRSSYPCRARCRLPALVDQVEHNRNVGLGRFPGTEIAGHQAPNVFGNRNIEFGGLGLGPPLQLGIHGMMAPSYYHLSGGQSYALRAGTARSAPRPTAPTAGQRRRRVTHRPAMPRVRWRVAPRSAPLPTLQCAPRQCSLSCTGKSTAGKSAA